MGSEDFSRYLKSVGIWLFMLIGMYFFWKWLMAFILPFVLATAIAVILEPLAIRLERLGLNPTTSVLLSLITGIGGCIALMGFLVGILVHELLHLGHVLPHTIARWQGLLDQWILKLGQWRQELGIDNNALHAQLGSIYQAGETFIRHMLTMLVGLPNGFLTVVVAMVAAFFLLRDRERVLPWMTRLFPPHLASRMSSLKMDMTSGMVGFLKAQLTLIGLTAVASTIGLFLIGSQYALLAGLAAGLLDLVPFMGPTAIFIPWAAIRFFSGDVFGAVLMLTVLTGVALTRQLVEPRLVGNSTGLHPLLALFAMYVGIQLFGPTGFFIGPISAVMLKAMAGIIKEPPSLGA